jgi:hypothetical protein
LTAFTRIGASSTAGERVSLAWESTRRDPLIAEFAALAEEFPAA